MKFKYLLAASVVSTASAMVAAPAAAQSTGSVDFDDSVIIISGARTTGVGGVDMPNTPKAKQVLGEEIIRRQRPGQTVNDIVNVAGNVIYMNPTICQGDSGGPLLTIDPEEVVGIASFGTGACGSGRNGHNVVYAFLEMVDDAIRASGVCVGDGEEVCDGEDNDCDDAVDEDCSRVGETCTDDSECVTLLCREIDGARICTQDCNPLRPFSSCPPSMFCATTAGCDGQCEFGEEGAGMNDETCDDATDCASLFCADPGDGRRRCLDPCMGDAGTCLAGDVCAAPPMACGGCVPAALVGEARGIGEPCEGPESCRSEICFTEESASYCSRDCTVDSDCGEAFHCRPATDASPGRCVRGERGGVGSGCVDNPDCGEGFFCAALGETRWCTSFCRETDECPPEFTCELVGEDTSICVPERGVVGAPCMGADECISGLCEPVGVEEALICSRECGGDAPCDPGFECRRSEDGSVAYCTRTLVPEVVESGGCATGGASAGSGFFLFLLIFAARRRRSISRGSHAS